MWLDLADGAGFVAELKEMVRGIVVELEKQCPEIRNVSEPCGVSHTVGVALMVQDELQRMVQLDEGVFGALIRASA
jgi:hypothetical protein